MLDDMGSRFTCLLQIAKALIFILKQQPQCDGAAESQAFCSL